ncbi:hypothetical protein FB45DRAFT_904056 [Roridomyces roridus]|uniref:Bromo domain-containing protein n=1 Tax=Roridomyces roridus TaxID=1738132 RepID=A0AAD7FRK8_9AGAR|nr:hypothetical protein FB45DRAFT_904056 [Roridomyces roridus]
MSRSRRSKSQVSAAAEGISVLDKLILAQSVWEAGPASWLKISRMMGKHPLLTHPKTFFTAQSCHAMYNHMMKESGFELSDANNAVHAPTHYKLAERYFAQRVEELRTLISAEEDQFKTISAEIEQIRAGQRDEEIQAKITGAPLPPTEAEAEEPPVEEEEAVTAPEPDVPADAVTEVPADETPEVEMAVPEPEAPPEMEDLQEQEALVVEAPQPSPPAAPIEEPEVESDVAENTPAEATPSSPIENLDHLMQASDEETPEKMPDVQVPDVQVPEAEPEAEAPEAGVPEEEVPEEEVPEAEIPEAEVLKEVPEEEVPEEEIPEAEVQQAEAPEAEPEAKAPEAEVPESIVEEQQSEATPLDQTVPENEVVPMEITEQPALSPKVEQQEEIESKPVSHTTDAPGVHENDATEDSISTRRSSRRRPSVSAAPALKLKRGRRPQQKSPQVENEAEQEATPVPTVKESTPAMDESQPDEEMPSPAAIRRRESKRKASVFGGVDSPRPSKRSREDSEPVDDEDQGPSSAILRRRNAGRTEEQVALKRFQTVITMVHNQISQHRNGNIFHNPIKPSEAADYHDIVKRPIDLKTIKAKVKDGVIVSSLEYQRDIYLMFANAMMYNRPGSDVHVMAEDMMVESEGYISTFRQTEGFVRRK